MGNNLTSIRGLLLVKQKDMAARLGISQQDYSDLEKEPVIEDEMLIKIAEATKFPVQTFKELDLTGKMSNIFNHNEGQVINYQIIPSDKINELYDKLLREKDLRIAALEKQIAELKSH